jgi:putative ABC transport system ATP-binding protein
MYRLDSVRKIYGRHGQSVTALDTTTLEIPDNDFIAVIGPSGSGKTTLLSVLGGMLAPTDGRVVLNGRSLYGLSVPERAKLRSEKLGFVFQSFNLIPWLSAVENVQVPLVLAGRARPEQRRRAVELLERVGLGDRVDHRPGELSQGQQQRVALARTLANDPEVILADEPTGNLDAETKRQVMELLSEFHRDGRTIVMVTHDADAASFAGRTIRLTGGVVATSGVPEAA